MIKLQITKYEDNPDYEEELKQHQAPYGRNIECPEKQIEVRKLDIEITDEEFKVIKKAVLEIF